ncbi:MAG: DUF4198 domain-containing protein [Lentilitoribacter sp.]
MIKIANTARIVDTIRMRAVGIKLIILLEKFMIYARVLSLLVFFSATSVTAHEFWIEPQDYTINASEIVVADLRNGQNFKGSSFAYIRDRYVKFDMFVGQSQQMIPAELGQRPAISKQVDADGLAILVVETISNDLSYSEWAKFQKFIDHKDFKLDKTEHLALGFPEKGFKEIYRRFAKSLVGVGNAKGADREIGLEIELVALSNPYTDDTSDGMPVKAIYLGKPLIDVQIELFDKAPSGEVEVTLHRTNKLGVATLPIEPGHSYLVDTVQLRQAEANNEKAAVWETLWASLTYAKD